MYIDPEKEIDLEKEGIINHCHCCGIMATDMENCGKCRLATYCSVECQRTHWKVHKSSCSKIKEQQTNAIVSDKKREHRLFRQWAEQAMVGLCVYCRYSTPSTEIQKFDRRKHAFEVQVDFDYNCRTFKPIAPAAIVSSEEAGKLLCTSFGLMAKTEELQGIVVAALVKYKTYSFVVPITFSVACEGCDMEDFPKDALRVFPFNQIKLSSSVFSKWDPSIRSNNIKKSLHELTSNKTFEEFIAHALHIPSKKPRHQNSVVSVELYVGNGLGQITSFKAFSVGSLDYTLSSLKRLLLPESFEIIQGKLLDLYGRYSMLPNSATLEGLSAPIVVSIMSAGLEVTQIKNVPLPKFCKKLPLHKCDLAAAKAFAKLKRLPIPQVESPDLNE
jgi:hypothetical protein